MRAAVRSVSSRSVSVRRAGAALTIGAATSTLDQAIALLRSVGGRMYLPGLTSRVASDGSGAVPVAGDVVGYVPDLVSGGLGPELLPAFDFTKWTPINNPVGVTQNSWTMDATGGGMRLPGTLVPGKRYSVTITFTTTSSSLVLFADAAKLPCVSGVPQTFVSDGTGFFYLRVSTPGTTTVSRIELREVIALAQDTTASKPLIKRVPILGPELVENGGFDSAASWVLNNGATVSGGVLTLPQAGHASQFLPSATLGKQYAITTSTDSGSAGNVFLNVYIGSCAAYGVFTSTAVAQKTVVIAASTNRTLIIQQDPNAVGTSAITNISVREILGYTERYSLEFDGVDDYMSASSAATLSDGLVMVWSGRKLDASAQDRLVALWDTATTTEAAISTTGAGVEVKLRVPGYGEFSGAAADFSVGAVTTVALRITASTASIRVNGGAWVNASHGRVLPGTLLSFGVSARPNGTLPATQAISAAMVANLGANATDANIAILERAAAQAVGITL